MPLAMQTKDGIRSGSPATVFASFLHFDMCFTIWVILGSLAVYIAKDLHLNDAEKGLMVAIPVLGGSLARLPVGILSDRFGSKRVGVIMLIFLFIPLALGWLIPVKLPALLAIGIMLGVAGASFAVALPLASRWYPPEQQGLVMGIAAAGNIGTVIANLFGPVLAKTYGWHGVLGLTMIALAAVLVVFILIAKESPTRPQGLPVKVYLRALKTADIWFFCLLYSVTFGGFVGLGSYLPTFFHDQYGLVAAPKTGLFSFAAAGSLTALAAFAGSTLRPFGGYIADKLGGTRTLTVLFVVIIAVYAYAAFLPPIGVMATILVIGVAFLGMGNGACFQVVPQRFRTEIGVATGLIGAFGGLGGFFLPTLLGYVKQTTHSYAIGWLVLSGMALVALVVLRILMATHAGWRFAWAPVSEVQLVKAIEVASDEAALDPTVG
jgi:MFS transporter, NNP family, nitrate/nitrite transporter